MFSLTNWADGTSGAGPVDIKLPLGKLAATDAKVIFIQLLKTPTQTAKQLSCRHINTLIFIRFLLTNPHHPAWESKFCKRNRQTLDAVAGQVAVPEQPGDVWGLAGVSGIDSPVPSTSLTARPRQRHRLGAFWLSRWPVWRVSGLTSARWLNAHWPCRRPGAMTAPTNRVIWHPVY